MPRTATILLSMLGLLAGGLPWEAARAQDREPPTLPPPVVEPWPPGSGDGARRDDGVEGPRNVEVIEHVSETYRREGAFGLRLGVGPAFIAGELESDRPGTPALEADLRDDLDIDPLAAHLEAAVTYGPFPSTRFEARAYTATWSGGGRADGAFVFGRLPVAAGASFDSEIRLVTGTLHVDHDIVHGPRAHHGFRAGGRYVRVDEGVRSGGLLATNRIESFLPFLGYQGGGSIAESFDVAAEWTFFPQFFLEGSGDDEHVRTSFAEFRLGARWAPVEAVTLGLDYSLLNLFVEKRRDDRTESLVLGTHSLIASAEVRF